MGLNMAGAAVIIPDASDGTDPENPYGDGKTLYISNSGIALALFIEIHFRYKHCTSPCILR